VGIFRRGTKDISAEPDLAMAAEDADDPAEPVHADDPDESGQRSTGLADHHGPFDRAEVHGLEGRLDLGALWVTGIPGMELRLEVEQESQSVVGVTAVLGGSAVQLQAFAAPRSEGIWDEIRTEIAASITSQGGTADVTSGPLGTELLARMPGQGPDGRTVFSPARFVGVDGPRWFLRAVLSGRAAIDEDAASALLDVVRSTVVVRGDEAMAPRELLALRLPDQADPAAQDVPGEEPALAAPALADLHPFERGPEITEIR
jgi:Protein of unknown function (DUF3710)